MDSCLKIVFIKGPADQIDEEMEGIQQELNRLSDKYFVTQIYDHDDFIDPWETVKTCVAISKSREAAERAIAEFEKSPPGQGECKTFVQKVEYAIRLRYPKGDSFQQAADGFEQYLGKAIIADSIHDARNVTSRLLPLGTHVYFTLFCSVLTVNEYPPPFPLYQQFASKKQKKEREDNG